MNKSIKLKELKSTQIDNFELTDTNGLAHQLYYYSYAPAVVLSSQNTTLPRVVGTENVVFFQINTTSESSSGSIPVLFDKNQLVSRSISLNKEGEVLVIDPKTWNIVYRGTPDSNYWKALDNLIHGKTVVFNNTAAKGRVIPLEALPVNIF